VTLQELIEQLQLMADPAASAQALSTTLSPVAFAQDVRATLELAHQENLTEVAGELEQF